jgi:hypothetical protein
MEKRHMGDGGLELPFVVSWATESMSLPEDDHLVPLLPLDPEKWKNHPRAPHPVWPCHDLMTRCPSFSSSTRTPRQPWYPATTLIHALYPSPTNCGSMLYLPLSVRPLYGRAMWCIENVSINFGDYDMIFTWYVRFPSYFTLIYGDLKQITLSLVFNVAVYENPSLLVFEFQGPYDH